MASLELLALLTSLTVASVVHPQTDWLVNYGAISKTLTVYHGMISTPAPGETLPLSYLTVHTNTT